MRNKIALGLTVVFSAFVFQSCDPWEDESYHPTGGGTDGPEVVMLLKEVKTVFNGAESLSTYTYDGQNRLSKILSYMDIQTMNTYTETVYQYPSNDHTIIVAKSHMNGELVSTSQVDMKILTSTTAQMTMTGGEFGDIITDITFSSPCGISKMITNMEFMGTPITSTTIHTYNDANCSYTEKVDGEWTQTVFNDDKYSPYSDPQAIAMGIVSHNPIKVEEADGTIEIIAYQYNENGYPTSAAHTFNQGGEQANYTETFTYY